MFYETGVPKNFAKFTGNHLCWSHFLINLQVFTENSRKTSNVPGKMTWATEMYLFWNMDIYEALAVLEEHVI